MPKKIRKKHIARSDYSSRYNFRRRLLIGIFVGLALCAAIITPSVVAGFKTRHIGRGFMTGFANTLSVTAILLAIVIAVVLVGLGIRVIVKHMIKKTTNVNIEVDINVFREYALNSMNPKNTVFKNLGYTGEHAGELVKIYMQQGLEIFFNDKYTLVETNAYGQKLIIPIKLDGIEASFGKTVGLRTVWILKEQKIRLIVPFCGYN